MVTDVVKIDAYTSSVAKKRTVSILVCTEHSFLIPRKQKIDYDRYKIFRKNQVNISDIALRKKSLF